jgi:hypothetical protein
MHALDRVEALVDGLGLIPSAAARFVARRLGLDPRDVLMRVSGMRRLSAWRDSPDRATSRPSRALATEETEEKETCP